MQAPANRVRRLNAAEPSSHGEYVLYWMIAARRSTFSYALDHAVAYARALGRPLLIFEPLRIDYPWASARLHAFVIEGMAANAAAFAKKRAHYYPYVEPEPGHAKGLLTALMARAAVVVTDDYPCFFLPRMIAAAAQRAPVRFEAVDGNGLLPLALADGKTFYNAYHFRRFVQRHVAYELGRAPSAHPLRRLALPVLPALPPAIAKRWPPARLDDPRALVASLPVDVQVAPVPDVTGGARAAQSVLTRFLEARLGRYERERNHPDAEVASGLSPYLHFGHLGVHAVLDALRAPEQWDGLPRGLAGGGQRTGFWGLSAAADAFLEELVTFRELAYNTAATLPDFDRYETLPAWAQRTLAAHAGDPREHVYTRKAFEEARTHDPLWNAAQCQLRSEGRIHNYLRMLWGKQILAWSRSPQVALETMIALNNRYALDGRDPNSYAGIFWVLGRYDRPWAPERPVIGSLRAMTSASTERKLRVRNYLRLHQGAKSPDATTGSRRKTRGAE